MKSNIAKTIRIITVPPILVALMLVVLWLNKLTDYIISVWYQDSDSLEYFYTLHAFIGSLYNIYRAWSQNPSSFSEEELAELIFSIYSK